MNLFALLTYVSVCVVGARCINVETRLDFGTEKLDKQPKLILSKKDDFEVGLVCTTEGCNKTETEGNSASAGVVVQVKTNIELDDKNKINKNVEDIPDVPIVVGYGGVTANPRTDDNTINLNPISVSNIDQTDFKSGHFQPSFGLPEINVEIKPPRPLIFKEDRQYYNPVNHRQNVYPQSGWNYRNGFVNSGPFDVRRVSNKPDWRQSPPWYASRNGYNYNTYHPSTTTSSPWTTCTCHPVASPWAPTNPTHRTLDQPTGTKINNKLAPLN